MNVTTTRILGLAATALVLVLNGAAAAQPSHSDPADASERSSGCRAAFDEAQRIDMESFRDYDVETWRAIHHPEATTVFPSGLVVKGPDNIVDALSSHFEDRVAIFTWTELDRYVSRGCDTGWISYDSTYEIPGGVYQQRSIVTVTYVREHGDWLVLADANTPVPDEG